MLTSQLYDELSALRVATDNGAEIESTLQRQVIRSPVGDDRKSPAFKQRLARILN